MLPCRLDQLQEVESSSDVVLYSGLSAGVLTVVVLIVVVTLYRRSHSEYGVDVIDSSALTGGFQSFTYKTSRQVWSGNPLLINSSMQPDLSVSRTYTSPMCFQDSMDKELMADHSLLDPLPDIMVKGRGERAEYPVMSHPRTFPRGVVPDYQGVGVDATLGRRGKTLFIPHSPPSSSSPTEDHQGAGPRMRKAGRISLLVPRGGIAEDTSWGMYMIINQEDSRVGGGGGRGEVVVKDREWVVVVVEEENWVVIVVEEWVVVEECVVEWDTAPEEEDEVLLSPEVTYGPPGLDLSCPVALTVAHCADLSGPADATWAVRLRRRTPENKWEVTSASP
ncbi:unnamed protein product [Arctogadus glacialis]